MTIRILLEVLRRFYKRISKGILAQARLRVKRLYFWLVTRGLNRPSRSSGSTKSVTNTPSGHTSESKHAAYFHSDVAYTESDSSIHGIDVATIHDNEQADSQDIQLEVRHTGDDIIDNVDPVRSRLSSISGMTPTAPELFQRYYRGETMQALLNIYKIFIIDAASLENSPVGWTAHIHPEGALYYVHETKRIFTDAHLHNPTTFKIASSFLEKIDRFLTENGICHEPVVDLVLDFVRKETGEPECGYYFADHRDRIVFWYDIFELEWLSHGNEVHGVASAQHIILVSSDFPVVDILILIMSFRRHCELFPSAMSLTSELVDELRDIVVHNVGDAMTSPTSTTPYSVDDLLKMLTVVESLKGSCVTLEYPSSQKFYLFHGEPCARLDKTQSVYGFVPRRSPLIKIVSPLLFNAPLTHLQAFESVYTDEIVSHAPWRRITDILDLEWQELILYATVLLNADMAFLAIPTVDNGEHPARSTSQICSYVSVVVSLGSIIVGLILSRQNRTRRDAEDYIDEAADFLTRHFQSRFGFESLAILYSLPFALLMWGYVPPGVGQHNSYFEETVSIHLEEFFHC
ncbi:hypothetical protein B0H10DRAFT_1954921 [Mycena sp. CBHHK59/15]|nr:hypothetical protein B0H10DRAFT_1954921 [Mycena sp. CBHHK59/15]